MSTAYSFTPPDEQDHAPVPAPSGETRAVGVDRNVRLLRRIPAGVFTAAYGAILVGVVVGGAMLIDYELSAEASTPTVQPPHPEGGPAPVTIDNVRESVRDFLITDTSATQTRTGVTLAGTMTPLAQEDLASFAGHVSRLLEQNCIDNLSVRSQDNMQFEVWGYCFNSPGQEAIESYLETGLNSGATSLTFSFIPWHAADQNVAMTWFEDSEEDAEKATRKWKEITPVGGVDRILLRAYGPEQVRVNDELTGQVKEITPTGEAFLQHWSVPPLAQR